MIASILSPPLYLITDRHQALGRPLSWVMDQALAGGIRLVQLREKDLPVRELLSLAHEARERTARSRARLLINDRIDICLAVQADGVHLRSDSLPTSTVRKILGPQKIIGVSTHTPQEAERAERGGADFITIGPIYETPSKAQYGAPLGLEVIRSARARIKIPIFALGGMRKEHVGKVIGAGADGIALISAVISAANPKEASSELIAELSRWVR